MSIHDAIETELAQLTALSQRRTLPKESLVSFSHNDYLGLAEHPEIREAGRKALEGCPAGSRGSRLLGGNTEAHEQAEASLAAYFGAPAALLFSSGYLANLAAITAFSPFIKGVYSDELNHASLIDGIRLSGKPKSIYEHLKFNRVSDTEGPHLVVTESLFSMDGDVIDWPSFWEKQGSKGYLLIDEAHAAGIMGEQGQGVSEGKRDWDKLAVTVTLGKAFGVGGAVILCSPIFKDWLINSARSFIYTTAPPPVVASLILASVTVMKREGNGLRHRLWKRAESVREALEKGLGQSAFPLTQGLWNRRSPILPVMVCGNDNALRLSQNMREFGFEIRAIRYPTVARGSERLRLSLNLSVTDTQTENMVEKLVETWTAYS